MKKYFLSIFLICFCSTVLMAQSGQFMHQFELGILRGNAGNWDGSTMSRTNLSIQSFHGARITENQSVGITLGYDRYEQMDLVPLGFGWRGFRHMDKKLGILGAFDLGYGSAFLEKRQREGLFETWYEGGFFFHPNIGLTFNAGKSPSYYTLSLGFKRQIAHYFSGFLDPSGENSINSPLLPRGFSSLTQEAYYLNSLSLKLGLVF